MKLPIGSPKQKCDICKKQFPEARMIFVLRGTDGNPAWNCEKCIRITDPDYDKKQPVLVEAGEEWRREE